MQWTRSETLALAKDNCTQCHGSGLRLGRMGSLSPCNCVLRAIFRICYDRFIRCATQEPYLSRISVEPHVGKKRAATWGRKDEEYIADFCLVSRRTLDDFEHRLFRYHFILGADWRLCSRKLGIDRGTFFHALYRIEQKLGRTFRELQPYPLFPLEDYFHGASRMITGPQPVIRKTGPSALPSKLRFPEIRRAA